ncbi:MAG: hydrogen peroxide-inducible genes activator [Gammaproteobacteria bacterium]
MNLSELRYIIALAQERHFGHAADTCHVSQPTLSVAVKKLEDELGVQLFERGSHEVRVTPVGEAVVTQAQVALEAVEAVRQAAQQGKDQLTAPLRIGAIYTVGPYLLPDLITNLRELAPNLPLLIEENYTGILTEKLKRGELDVILISPPYKEPNILTLPVYEEPFVILLPSSHPLTARKSLHSKDLENESILLLGEGHCFRDQVIEACPACAPKARTDGNQVYTSEGSSLETIRHMVASGMGLTILPCTAAGVDRYSQRLITIKRFSNPIPRREVALAWRVSFPRPKVIDVLKEAIITSELSCIKPVKRKRAAS